MANDKIKWVKFGKTEGPSYMGTAKYNPPQPWDEWTKIIGVIARCEGNHDTVTMYDGTGVTWGFMQWTFTSGRLQRLLEYMKSIPAASEDHPDGHPFLNLYDEAFHNDVGSRKFLWFDFDIISGRFVDMKTSISLDPNIDKKRINEICTGVAFYPAGSKDQIDHAKRLAQVFADAGKLPQVQKAQVDFAKAELKSALVAKRTVLNGKTINDILPHPQNCGEIPPIAWAIFWNLWQNNPGAAYKLYSGTNWGFTNPRDAELDKLWKKLNASSFGNWGFKSKRYLEGKGDPRVVRIRQAVKEFYGVDLPLYRPSK